MRAISPLVKHKYARKANFLMHEPDAPTEMHTESEARQLGYARVSTADQNPQLQIDAFRKDGVRDKDIYWERVSGAAKKRPEFNRMLRELRPGDIITVWKLDRLGRTLRQVLDTIERIQDAGAHLRIITQHLDTSTPMGKCMLAMVAAFAELERDLAIERTIAGLASAAAQGRRGGARPQYAEEEIAWAAVAFRDGATYKFLASQIKNRKGDKTITPTQLKRRIDEHGRRKAT
jgi:DNA invertase Pin-like site-specific DNA recombinase